MSTLAKGAMEQARVVHALALRETRTRFGKHKLGYVWALVEPVLWMGTFYAMYELVGRHLPDGMSVVPFLATGILTYGMFAKTASQGAAAIGGNMGLLFYPHVQPLDLVIARTVLEGATYIVVFALVMGTYGVATQTFQVDSLLVVMGGFALAISLGMTFGLVLCALAVSYPAVDRIRSPLMRPLFWTSGLFFTANELPSSVRDVLLYNPVLHCTEIVRDGWFPAYHATHADPVYPLVWTLGFAFVGLTLERTVRKKIML